MSQSSTHALSARLFMQAAVTALLAPLAKGGSTWMVIAVAVAAGAVAVAMLLRSNPANAKAIVIGYEAVALTVGGMGIAGGHYIPGTIVGVITLIAVLHMPAGGAARPESPWVPPADVSAEAPAADARFGAPAPDAYPAPAPAYPAPAPAYPAPAAPATPAAPVMDNPYAPPAPVPAQAAAPMVEAAPVEPAAVEPPALPEPVAEVTQPLRPEDIPPAPRAMTILPGR